MSGALALLRELKQIHEAMAQRAGLFDWPGAGTLWQSAQARFSAFKEMPLTALSATEREEARQLIETLLRQQKALSDQANAWMEHARPLLETFERSRAARETLQPEPRKA